ncbi:hypothetical protein [Amycolatopsis pigmentata]|uniref:Uncharacterized protein n=1 Tax=Amycolatopsis pigmentata TaxID=450801 RepID=A0ABW5FWS3_9PSEU
MKIKRLFVAALAGAVLIPLAPGIAAAETLRWRPHPGASATARA